MDSLGLDFSGARARTLARLAAYVLLITFVITAASAWLPLQPFEPAAGFARIGELIANSTVPLVALVLLYFGLADEALPALWECRLAGLLRPLLALVALLYLLTAVASFSLAGQLEKRGVTALEGQLGSSLEGIERLQEQVRTAPDAESLQRLLAPMPDLQAAMRQEGAAPGGDAPLAEQRRRAGSLLERAEANLRRQGLRQRADASGDLGRQALRSGASALAYALFYAGAALTWPASLAATRQRVLEAREERRRLEAEEEERQNGWSDEDSGESPPPAEGG